MRANKPKSAASLALYQMGQAIKVDQVDPDLAALGRQVVAGELPFEEAQARLIEKAQAPLERQLVEQANGLLLAVEASGMTDFAKGMRHLTATWDDPEEFARMTETLKLAFKVHGEAEYGAAMERLQATYQRIVELDDITAGKLSWAIDKAVRAEPLTQTTTTEWRQDTDPRLASLLKINPEHAPRYTQLVHVMEARASDGQPIPGKRYFLPGTDVRFGVERQSGFTEIRYAAPKAVSVAYALAKTPEERSQIFDAHRAAVHKSLLEVEKTIGQYRGGAGGTEPQPGRITWVLFHHATARATPGQPPDPHLHTHAIIPNVVMSQDGQRVGALHGRAMRGKGNEVITNTYRQTLVPELVYRGLDARYVPERRDVELGHITPELVQQFSKRSQYAVAHARTYLAKRGGDYDALPPRQKQAVRNTAVQVTRKAEHGYQGATPGQIELKWHAQARKTGWEPKPAISRERVEKSRGIRLTGIRAWGIADGGPFPVHRPER